MFLVVSIAAFIAYQTVREEEDGRDFDATVSSVVVSSRSLAF